MEFHPKKCQLLRITRKRAPIIANYTIHGHTLDTAESGKYLGLNFHRQLSWSQHINQTAKKANRVRAFLQRNIRSASYKVKKQCYETLVRPTMEYGSIIWDQTSEQSAHQLEMVQRRFARFLKKDYESTSSVTQMLRNIGWDKLQTRRTRARATMIYRIRNDLVDIPASSYLTPLGTRSRNSEAKFRVPYARTLAYKNSFFPGGIRIWNTLPSDVTSAESLDIFKKRLSGHLDTP